MYYFYEVNAYRKGRAFEYRVKKLFEGKGYFVVRSAGSNGSVDLVAVRKGCVLFVQCKRSGYLAPLERKSLTGAASFYGACACLASIKKRRIFIEVIVFENKKGRPCRTCLFSSLIDK